MREGPPCLVVTQMLLDDSTTFCNAVMTDIAFIELLQLVWEMFLELRYPFV